MFAIPWFAELEFGLAQSAFPCSGLPLDVDDDVDDDDDDDDVDDDVEELSAATELTLFTPLQAVSPAQQAAKITRRNVK